MIFIGFKYNNHKKSFETIAMSEGFLPVGSLIFSENTLWKFEDWILNLLIDPDETVNFCFDENEFYDINFPKHLFIKYCNNIWLIKHRMIMLLLNFIQDYSCYFSNNSFKIDYAYLILVAFKLADTRFITFWMPEDDMPF